MAAAPLGAAFLLTAYRDATRRHELEGVVAALSRAEPLGSGHGRVTGADFARADGAGWLDAEGRAVATTPEHELVLSDADGPVVRLHLAAGARGEEVRAALTPATRLALRNAQLAASLRGRLRDVQDSQRRVVEVSDAERSRIERDLHDGAQQRLVGVAFHLRLARGAADPSTAERLAEAEDHVLGVLANLRRLSHGSAPSVLVDEGLEAAVAELSDPAPVPCRVDVEVDGSLPAAVTRAAYVAVSGVLGALTQAGPDARAEVRVVRELDDLVVRVRAEGLGGRVDEDLLVEAADRVGALGGRWRWEQGAGGVDLEAVVPCGW